MPSPDAGATTPAASPATTTSRPLSHFFSGFSGIGAPSRRIVAQLGEPRVAAQRGDGVLQRPALVGAADADARLVAVREDPRVEIGRQLGLVIDVAALAVERGVGRRRDHLVIGEDARRPLGPLQRGAGDARPCAVGPDDRAGPQPLERVVLGCALRPVDDDRGAVGVALDRLVGAGLAPRPGKRGAVAQPLVELAAVDHADEAALDRHVDRAVGRRDHPRRLGVTDEDRLGNREVASSAAAGSRRRTA